MDDFYRCIKLQAHIRNSINKENCTEEHIFKKSVNGAVIILDVKDYIKESERQSH